MFARVFAYGYYLFAKNRGWKVLSFCSDWPSDKAFVLQSLWAKNASNTQDFWSNAVRFFRSKSRIFWLIMNLFSNKLHWSKKGNAREMPSKFNEKCQKYEIDHRLTHPATPKTNGMVERVNGIIKSAVR